MTSITRSLTIEATRETVWSVLTDFANIAEWADNVNHSCLVTGQASDVGAARRIQQGRRVVIETVTAWDPPRTLEYRFDGLPARVGTVRNRWDLSARDGDCEVSLTATAGANARGPARFASRAVGMMLGRVNAHMLEDLGRYIEAGGGPG